MKTIKIPTEKGKFREAQLPAKLEEIQINAMIDCLLENDPNTGDNGALYLKLFNDLHAASGELHTITNNFIRFLLIGLSGTYQPGDLLVDGIKALGKDQLAELVLYLLDLMDPQSHINRWKKVEGINELLKALKGGESKLFKIENEPKHHE